MPLAVCATPIGNLDDVTLRLLAELRESELVLCEDTRVTRSVLLERHGIGAAAQLPRAQRGAARRGGAPAAHERSGSRSSRTRGSRRQRSRRAARRGCARRRRAGDGAAGAVGRRDRARRGGARRRALPVRRVPAPRRACAALALEELARWPRPPWRSSRRSACRARLPRSPPFSPSGRRPSVASRRSSTKRWRAAPPAGGALRGATEGGTRAGPRARRGGGRVRPTQRMPPRRSASSSRPGYRAGAPPSSSRGSLDSHATPSTSALCNKRVTISPQSRLQG